jgi:hypothetical protein
VIKLPERQASEAEEMDWREFRNRNQNNQINNYEIN